MEALLLGDGSDDSLSEDDNAIGSTAPKVSTTSTIKTTTTTSPLQQQQSKPEAKPTTSSSSIAPPRVSAQEIHAEAPPQGHPPPRGAPLFPNNNLIMGSPPPAPSVMQTSHPQPTQLLQQQASNISATANHYRPTNRPSPQQQQQQQPYFNHTSTQLPPKPSAQPSPHRGINMNNNNNIKSSRAANTKPPSSNNDPFDFDFNMIEPTPLAEVKARFPSSSMNSTSTTSAMGIPSTSTVHHHPQQPRMPSTSLPPPPTNSSRSTAASNTNIHMKSSHSNYPVSKSTMPIIAPPQQQQQHQSGLAPNINMNNMRPPQKQSSTASAASTTTSATTVPTSNTAPQPIGKPHIKTDAERRKEQFLMFTRVLMKFLEQKDAPMHATARAVIKNCAERHRAKVPGYESLTSVMQSQLRQTVGEAYWKKSEALLVHILKQQKQRNASSSTSQQPPPVGGRPAQPPIHGGVPHTAMQQPQQQPQQHPQQQPHPQQPQLNKQPIILKQPSSQVAIDNNKTKEPKISEEKKKKTPPTAKSKSIVPSVAAPPPTGLSTTKSPSSDSAKAPMPLTIPLPNNSTVTKTTTPTTKTAKKRPPKKKPAATDVTKVAAQPKKSSTPIAAAAAAAAAAAGTTAATTGQHKKDEEIKQQVSNTSVKKVVNKPEVPRPTKIYEEWMEEVDHAVSYDMTTAMNLLSKENLTDVDLQDEQKQLLYGQRKKPMPSIVSPLSSSDFTASTTASSWSTRNIISSRIAWALIRLPELEASKPSDSALSTVSTTDTCCPDKWYNEETAESSDPTLYLISEATQCYIRTILENAVVASRRRCNLDGMRLWHMQHTTISATKNTHPPLALRLGCNVRRQLALANGNAAKVSERLEEALARSSNKKRKSDDDGDVVVPSWLEATSMGDLSMRVFVKDVAEEKRKEASHHATKFFAEYGGKFAGEPPFGRVPTENVLTLKDIMPSIVDLASHKKRRMLASTRHRSLF